MSIPFSHALVMSKFSTIMSPAMVYNQNYNNSGSFVKTSNPLRGGSSMLNRLQSTAGNLTASGSRRRSSRALLPLAALGATGAGAAGLYASGYGNELLGRASQFGDDLYGRASEYGDIIRNADYGDRVNELIFRTGLRERDAIGRLGARVDDFISNQGIELPSNIPSLGTLGSTADSAIQDLGTRIHIPNGTFSNPF